MLTGSGNHGLALRKWVEAALSFFYPEVCQVCRNRRAAFREGYVCPACSEAPNGVRFIVPPFCRRCGLPFEGEITPEFECSNCRGLDLGFDFARAAVSATPLVLEVIHRYKYDRALWFEPFLGRLLVESARKELSPRHWDWIVPVPLHPVKKREREFNQAERLAAILSRATAIPVQNKVLRRVAFTETQTLLSRAEREQNMRRVFTLVRPGGLNGVRIVLVDDVLTTGATSSACAKVLRQNGAGRIGVWTVARGRWT